MGASGPQPRGADRVREVFTRVGNGDHRVADLYADDGVVLVGDARIEGREDGVFGFEEFLQVKSLQL
jgi:hypothetical protein